MTEIQKRLFELQDLTYRDFQSKLMPTVDKDTIIGVRTPLLRKLAKTVTEPEEFLDSLPHKYYEENNLHAYLLERIRDYDECVRRLCEFLPYVDNWATCDSMLPKVLFRNHERLLPQIDEWLKSDKTYTVRFGIGLLMGLFADEHFDVSQAQRVAEIRTDEYYIKMMQAWYFATLLAKQWEKTVPFIENRALEPWTHNKAIQKAIESYRITDDRKIYLKTLKTEVK